MNGAMNFRSRLVPLPINNVDTDQIIPARFLKTISKQGLDKQLFNDWRYDAQGQSQARFHPEPAARARRADSAGGRQLRLWQFARACPLGVEAIRIPGRNQHLVRRHFQAEFAEECVASHRGAGRCPRGAICAGGTRSGCGSHGGSGIPNLDDARRRQVEFPIDEFSKHCLLEGVDELGYILKKEAAIADYEAGHASSINTLA